MRKKYLIITDNSFILQFEVSAIIKLEYRKGYLEIFSSSNKALEDIEKGLIQLKLDYKFDKIEHTLRILCNVNLSNYNIYISDNRLI